MFSRELISGRKRLIVFLVLVFLLISAGTAFAKPTDINGHWSEDRVNAWVDMGLIKGYQDGTFRPDNRISRAEFIALINRAFGYEKQADTDFTDISANDWFFKEITKAKAVRYISGYDDGTFRPSQPISRQEAASILARILKLNGSVSVEDKEFKDASAMASWSRGAVKVIVGSGYMSGYPNGTFRPESFITRGEAVTLVSKAAGTLYDTVGEYGPEKGSKSVKGNVTITKSGITLQNIEIDGNLYLTEGIGDGHITLNNVKVKGRTTVSGGGINSIIVVNSSLGSVIVEVPDGSKVRIVASGSSEISSVEVKSGAKLEETDLTGKGFANVEIAIPTGVNIELKGDFSKVQVNSANAKIDIKEGAIEEVVVTQKATGSTLNLAAGAIVSKLNLGASATVSGQGKIEAAHISTVGCKIEQTPTKTTVDNGITATVGGSMVSGGEPSTPPVAGGGGGGGGGGGVGTDESADTTAPILQNVTTGSITVGSIVYAALNENGYLYLVPQGTAVNKQAIQVAGSQPNGAVQSCVSGAINEFSTLGLNPGNYIVYGIDVAGNISIGSALIILVEPQKPLVMSGVVYTPEGNLFTPQSNSSVEIKLVKFAEASERLVAHAVVNSLGSYELRGNLEEGYYILFVIIDGSDNPYSEPDIEEVFLSSDGILQKDLRLLSTSVTGTVYSPEGEILTPLQSAGANISIWSPGVVKNGRINDNGVFKIGGLPDGIYQMQALTDRNNPYTNSFAVTVNIQQGTVPNLGVELTNPQVIGQVVTPGGEPILLEGTDSVDVHLSSLEGQGGASVRINSNGTFKLGGLRSGSYLVNTWVEGYSTNLHYTNTEPTIIEIDENIPQNIDIKLTPPQLKGFVKKPDGTPLDAGLMHGISLSVKGMDGVHSVSNVRRDGSFLMGGLPSGRYELSATVWGEDCSFTDSFPLIVDISKDSLTERDIQLTNPQIHGYVKTPEGDSLNPERNSYGIVEIRFGDGSSKSTGINSDGSFKVGGLKDGTYELLVRTSGIDNGFTDSLPVKVQVTRDTVVQEDIHLTYPQVTGQLCTPDGSPVNPGNGYSASIEILGYGDVSVHPNGTFRIGGLAEGSYQLVARVYGNSKYTNSYPETITIRNGQPMTMEIKLTNPVVEGRVVTPDNKTIEWWKNYNVYLEMRSENLDTYRVNVGSDGSFKIGGIQPGTYSLKARVSGTGSPYTDSFAEEVVVESEEKQTVNISLTYPKLRGQILTPAGDVYLLGINSFANVYLHNKNQFESTWASVERDGTYKAGGIPDGEYEIFVRVSGADIPFTDSISEVIYINGDTVKDIVLTNPQISGSLLAPDDSPVYLSNYDNVQIDIVGQGFRRSVVNRDGTFKIGGLSAGEYSVRAIILSGNLPYSNSLPVDINIESGTNINLPIKLSRPQIKGFVMTPEGEVYSPGYNETLEIGLWSANAQAWFSVGVDGAYRLGGLPSGEYTLTARIFGKDVQYSDAIPMTITISDASDIIQNISLTIPSVIGRILTPEQTVFLPDPEVAADVVVTSILDGSEYWVHVNGDGTFKVGGLVPGSYEICVRAWGEDKPYYDSVTYIVYFDGDNVVQQDLELRSSPIPAIVNGIVKVDGGEVVRYYLKTIKFDGTQVIYEVTPDTKVNGMKINVDALMEINGYEGFGGPRLISNSEVWLEMIVGLWLTSEGMVEDISTSPWSIVSSDAFDIDEAKSYLLVNGDELLVDEESSIIEVISSTPNLPGDGLADVLGSHYYGEISVINPLQLTDIKKPELRKIAVVRSGSKAKYVIIQTPRPSEWKYGVIASLGMNMDGNFVDMLENGEVNRYSVSSFEALYKGNMIKFKTDTNMRIVDYFKLEEKTAVAEHVYNTYQVEDVVVINGNNMVKVNQFDGINTIGTAAFLLVDYGLQVYDITNGQIRFDSYISKGDIIKVYDEINGETGEDGPDGIIDFVVRDQLGEFRNY